MTELTLLSPAKINRTLRIIGRRHDGYHLLQTVFQFLDWADELRFSVNQSGVIRHTRNIPGVAEETDLILRAAHLMRTQTRLPWGVDITVTKNLPIGAGLGGGSSNAATTLLALNRLWQVHLPLSTLAELGLQLGADVPVFVHGAAAWAEGVGERLTPIDLDTPLILLLIPPVMVSTKAVFNAPLLPRHSPPATPADFAHLDGANDCTAVVLAGYPPIAAAFAALNAFAPARLTGTGCAIYALFNNELAAKQAAQNLAPQWPIYLGKTLNHSPLHSQLDWL